MENQMISEGLRMALQSANPVIIMTPDPVPVPAAKTYPRWVNTMLILIFTGIAYHVYTRYKKEELEKRKSRYS